MSEIKQLLIIGCGNMGGAMLAGWLADCCMFDSLGRVVNTEVKVIFDDVRAACEPEVCVGGRPRSLVANKSKEAGTGVAFDVTKVVANNHADLGLADHDLGPGGMTTWTTLGQMTTSTISDLRAWTTN